MEVEDTALDAVVLPGDHVGTLSLQHGSTLRIGPGLFQYQEQIRASRAGFLRRTAEPKYYIDGSHKRYFPGLGDTVVGIVIEKHSEEYKIDILAHAAATLSVLAFDGASRRNRPNLKVGDVAFAKVIVAHKDMEPELSCESPTGVKRKDWVTGESVFGQLKKGIDFQVPLSYARTLLDPRCVILESIGKVMAFEIVVGMNGRVWINTESVRKTILLRNAIIHSEYLNEKQIRSMARTLSSEL